ncbi:hypothetical protein CROQUDRAFT_179153 [Cronartium quercuum f. sp. fusiforme G11]|uniref:Secreted protein n=1 Tax=Cronartium quercuum f. sp. fusiforme G11 TaxID=708437 RepID=A0A9P6THB2_9BASI|nr:hypothetical protein CROQUDRAFT_179153 [Cronartium quercuum f. sp. fusiforme G11]
MKFIGHSILAMLLLTLSLSSKEVNSLISTTKQPWSQISLRCPQASTMNTYPIWVRCLSPFGQTFTQPTCAGGGGTVPGKIQCGPADQMVFYDQSRKDYFKDVCGLQTIPECYLTSTQAYRS